MNTIEERLNACEWPELAQPYADALRQAARFILARFEDVLGIVVSGTILRGNPAPTSDLDIYVLREKPARQRIQRFFEGVPAEIFVNPVAQVYKYFEQEVQDARPITAHMLATGFTILARGPAVAELQQRAREVLAQPPNPDAQKLTTLRYMVATRYEDARDVVETRPATARMILGLAVHGMLQYHFWKARRYLPRDKDLLAALDEVEPPLARLARDFYQAPTLARCLVCAEQVAERTIETHGFFEWESELEQLD